MQAKFHEIYLWRSHPSPNLVLPLIVFSRQLCRAPRAHCPKQVPGDTVNWLQIFFYVQGGVIQALPVKLPGVGNQLISPSRSPSLNLPTPSESESHARDRSRPVSRVGDATMLDYRL